jgi:hypothetical protein
MVKMKTKIFLLIAVVIISSGIVFGQSETGKITGKVIDFVTKEPLPGVNILVMETSLGASTNLEGEFEISGLEVGTYRIRASFVGYNTVVKTDVVVTTSRPADLLIELSDAVVELEGVTVTGDYFLQIPTEIGSIKQFNYEEIRRAPGGFEDVVRALSVLPGVAQTSAGRNDLVVRGGAPSENLYLVDGLVIPNINHFGSQGATGGPLSFINLDFVNNTTFSTGGFSALYGDKLSSVLSIDLREGRKDRLGGKALISATQFGLNLEGPIGDRSNFIFSARRSYLDFIFNAAGFNFVPEYWDLLGKYTFDIDTKNRLNFLFVGAFDRVKFNNESTENIYDNSSILGSNQNQYTAGLSYRHLFDSGFYTISLSRNFVDYDSFQNDTLLNPIFKNISTEGENVLKGDIVYKLSSSSEINAGVIGKLIDYEADIKFPEGYVTTFGDTLPYNQLNADELFTKAGLYLQYTKLFFSRLRINLGVRGDYFNAIDNGFTFSPRFSASYRLTDITNLNFSTGIYRQYPSYIWLTADETNRSLNAIRVNQYIAGIDHLLREDIRVKLEGFYKDYSDYPASLVRPYLVLANTGAGFGGTQDNFSSLGLEPLVSQGFGNSRGVEFSMQKKSSDIPHYGILSLTYSQTYFTSLDGVERPGQYDQRWILNASAGYIFNRKWEASFRFRFATGAPYTPYNADGTQSVDKYLSERFPLFHSLDVRVDRRWEFDGWSLITYIDIQNIYNRDNVTTISWDAQNQRVDEQSAIGILPSIGINLQF